VFTHPNAFASYLLFSLALSLAAVRVLPTFAERALAASMAGLGAICLFGTYTRSAWIAAVLMFLYAVRRSPRLRALALVGFVAALIAAPTAKTTVENRFSTVQTQDSSWTWRLRQWQLMLPDTPRKLIIGTGYGTYERGTVERLGLGQHPGFELRPVYGYKLGFSAHNDFMKSLVELGVAGAALWIATLAGLARTGWRLRRDPRIGPLGDALVAVAIGSLTMGLSDNVENYNTALFLSMLVAGAAYGVHHGGHATDRKRV
jgi:O-antigen ligase